MLNHDHSELIKLLQDCAATCEWCATSCLAEEDCHMLTECIRLDRDCADICRMAATLLQRNSRVGHQYLLLCEQICRMCSEECSGHKHMEHCRKCAEICLQCAEACHQHHEPITIS